MFLFYLSLYRVSDGIKFFSFVGLIHSKCNKKKKKKIIDLIKHFLDVLQNKKEFFL